MKRRTFLLTAGSAAVTPALALPVMAESRLATPFDFTLARVQYRSGNWDVDPLVAQAFRATLERHTAARVRQLEQVVALDSEDLCAFPLAFLSGNHTVDLSPSERKGLERYVANGGLLFADDCNHDANGPFAVSFEREIARVFGPTSLQTVPARDSLYWAHFAFPDGPPPSGQETNCWGDGQIHAYLRAVRHNGRIGLIYSNKDYGCGWSETVRGGQDIDVPSGRFAVNLIAYAKRAHV